MRLYSVPPALRLVQTECIGGKSCLYGAVPDLLWSRRTSHTVVYLSEILMNAKEVGLQLNIILEINL